jgi:hypothetical protein
MEPGSKALRAPDIVKSLRVIVSPLALQTHKFDPVIAHEEMIKEYLEHHFEPNPSDNFRMED